MGRSYLSIKETRLIIVMWQSLMCLVVACHQFKPDLLSGDTVTVSSIENPPYLKVDGNDNYSGFVVDLLAELSKRTKANFNIKLVKDGKYGWCDSVNDYDNCHNWNGMIGEVYRGSADMAVADITVTPKRLTAVDFSESFMSSNLVLIAPKHIDKTQEMLYGIVEGGSTERFLKTSTLQAVVKMKKNLKVSCSSMQDCFNNYDEERANAARRFNKDLPLALIAEKQTAEGLVNTAQDPCRWQIINFQADIRPVNYGIALAKGAAKRHGATVHDIRTVLDYHISAMKYEGVLTGLKSKYWPEAKC